MHGLGFLVILIRLEIVYSFSSLWSTLWSLAPSCMIPTQTTQTLLLGLMPIFPLEISVVRITQLVQNCVFDNDGLQLSGKKLWSGQIIFLLYCCRNSEGSMKTTPWPSPRNIAIDHGGPGCGIIMLTVQKTVQSTASLLAARCMEVWRRGQGPMCVSMRGWCQLGPCCPWQSVR